MPTVPNGHVDYRGYTPGAIGRITEAHAVYYHRHWGFDQSFEIQVATELSRFVADFDSERDGLWEATVNNLFAGAIAIAADSDSNAARLRWFIVLPEFQGCRIGKTLIQQAMAFSRKTGYDRMYLWTFEGLDRARALYGNGAAST